MTTEPITPTHCAFWTRNSASSRWVQRYANEAYRRSVLVKVARPLEPTKPTAIRVDGDPPEAGRARPRRNKAKPKVQK